MKKLILVTATRLVSLDYSAFDFRNVSKLVAGSQSGLSTTEKKHGNTNIGTRQCKTLRALMVYLNNVIHIS